MLTNKKRRKDIEYRSRMYETCVTPASERNCICSSVAPMKRKPDA
jgi:hypothetical protein